MKAARDLPMTTLSCSRGAVLISWANWSIAVTTNSLLQIRNSDANAILKCKESQSLKAVLNSYYTISVFDVLKTRGEARRHQEISVPPENSKVCVPMNAP